MPERNEISNKNSIYDCLIVDRQINVETFSIHNFFINQHKKKRNTRPFVTLVTNRNALRYVTLRGYETLLSRNGMLRLK